MHDPPGGGHAACKLTANRNEGTNAMGHTNITIGILAHVDAGKTTLSESILYRSGSIRTHGRVDHGDAFLDTDALEKRRGITIYSKLARFTIGEQPFTLLDTPGHADFSPEMERALRVMDYAILVISAAEGVTANGRTLWKLFAHYGIPVLIFVNKMDQLAEGKDLSDASVIRKEEQILKDLTAELSPSLVRFDEQQLCPENEEAAAVTEDALMERVLEGAHVTEDDVIRLIRERRLFPVYFGAALTDQGTDVLLEGMRRYLRPRQYAAEFGAVVYKITREDRVRLTWMKITGGSLAVRDSICGKTDSALQEPGDDTKEAGDSGSGQQMTQEKVSGIRLYSGDRYRQVTRVEAGEIAAVEGLDLTRAGDGLGTEEGSGSGLIAPIETCSVRALPDAEGRVPDEFTLMAALRGIEEQEPLLHVTREEQSGDIRVEIMGQVQIEVLKNLLEQQYHIHAEFGEGTIVYRETIRKPVEGVGHFEPLRHYAEVHVVLTPTEPGSGVTYEADCPPDTLDRSWQKLILGQLSARRHRGVLTGSELTDVRITLIGGKASVKHTEGGDFRRAANRAVRQALMSAENVLLEPVMAITLELPAGNLGRALTDLNSMHGRAGAPEFREDGTVLVRGSVPASCLGTYAQEVAAYTGGRGRIQVSLKGYEPCHNAREVMDAIAYNPDEDKRNVSYSVFCSHGAGTAVPWDHVREHMHVETGWEPGPEWEEREREGKLLTDDYYTFVPEPPEEVQPDLNAPRTLPAGHRAGRQDQKRSFEEEQEALKAQDEELRTIFERTYGPIRQNLIHPENEKYYSGEPAPDKLKPQGGDPKYRKKGTADSMTEYLLVDGYNIIFAWSELRDLAGKDIKAARDRLVDLLSDYAGTSRETVIVVFDAYRVPGSRGEVLHCGGIDVVYTKEAETADLYIEKTAHRLRPQNRVTVATSDAVEQVIIYGTGAVRLSARGLLERILLEQERVRERYLRQTD